MLYELLIHLKHITISKNLLTIYRKYRNLIGYRTRYLSDDK